MGVEVRAYREGVDLFVTVTDTGIGVAPEDHRERIFESFQQGRRGPSKGEGTGLGLTLSRRIVELSVGAYLAEQHPRCRKHFRVLDSRVLGTRRRGQRCYRGG